MKLFTPVDQPDSEDGTPLQGYYRHFGVRAAPDRVQVVIANAISDGAIQWDDTEWSVVDLDSLDKAVLSRIEPVAGEGIWYQSGRLFYADPDLEPPPQ